MLALLGCMSALLLIDFGRVAQGGPAVPPIRSMSEEHQTLAIEDCIMTTMWCMLGA